MWVYFKSVARLTVSYGHIIAIKMETFKTE